MEKVRETPSSRARPDGNQTALHHGARGRSLFWLRAESHFCSSGNRTAAEHAWPRLLPFAELCPVPVDSGGRNRKTSSGILAGVERRRNNLGCLLETAFHARLELHTGVRKGRTRQPTAAIRARAHDFRRSAGNLAQRRDGFDDHSALRVASHHCPTEDIFDLISRKKVLPDKLHRPRRAA